MSHPNQSMAVQQAFPMKEWLRMKELATTAERKARQYTDKQGVTRIIKARPSRKGILPFGESTIYEMVRRGTFPKSRQLSPRVSVWRATDIAEWVNSKGIGQEQAGK